MKLIYADKLIEYYVRLSTECVGTPYENIYDMVAHKVAEQPTTYDVEKVVKEINNIKIGGDCRHKCEHYDWSVGACQGICEDYIKKCAIEIVRRGGVDENIRNNRI